MTAAPTAREWESRGRRIDVHGLRVFVLEEGSRDVPRAALVLLHGYPTSSYDFWRVLPRLARSRRVVVHDHPGFGLSEKPPAYSYSLMEQAEIALGVWEALGITDAHLVAHDYGTSVATEILARQERGYEPVTLRSVTLSNGSVFIEMARFRWIQRLLRRPLLGRVAARLATRAFFGRQIRGIVADPEAVSETELDALWALLVREEGRRRIPAITGYLDERRRFRERWISPLRSLDLPAHLLWGAEDPVAVPAIGERLARVIPDAAMTRLDGVGHIPMLEAGAAWAEGAERFLGRLPGG